MESSELPQFRCVKFAEWLVLCALISSKEFFQAQYQFHNHSAAPAACESQMQRFAPGCRASLGSRLPKCCARALPTAKPGFHTVHET